MRRFYRNSKVITFTFVFALGLAGPVVALAATAPSLGSTSTYGVVSSTFTNSNTSPQTIINGNVCYTTPPTTVPLSINGVISGPPCPPTTGMDQAAALTVINSQLCTSLGTNVVLAGTITPGCYSSSGSMDIVASTTLTLNGPGVYIFRPGGALTTGANSSVVLTNGATASNVFWAPVGATAIGANATPSSTPTFVGTIIDDAGISLGHFANLLGRALDFATTVTTDANTINVPTTLNVIKLVVNSSGGTAIPSNFSVHVKNAGVDVAGSPVTGTSAPGTAYYLTAGTYTVSEDANPSYTQSFLVGDCDISGNVTLATGDDKTCTIINTDIPAVPGFPSTGGSGALAITQIAPPLISITTVPHPLALPETGPVTYNYTVLNAGAVPMNNVTVTDDKCPSVGFISGDADGNSMLDVNETWMYRCSTAFSQTTTNTAIATGRANGFTVFDTAISTVYVGVPLPPPLIHLIKTPSTFVLPIGGGAVTYMYTVTNPGPAPLSNVSVTDNKCTGLSGRVSGDGGDLNQNNLLESNETWSFICQTYITQTTTNIGTAEGSAYGLTATDFSPATVVVATPDFPNTGPGLPNTGFPSSSPGAPWSIILPALALVILLSLYLGYKKQII